MPLEIVRDLESAVKMPYSLTGWHDVNHPGTSSGGFRELIDSKVSKVNKRIVVLLDFIAMRDPENDSASGTTRVQISSMDKDR